MQSLPVSSASDYQIVPHFTCAGELDGNQGAYEVMLNAIQSDELAKNNYTITTETCRLCYETSTIVLRLVNPVSCL